MKAQENSWERGRTLARLAALSILVGAGAAWAQGNPNQFGGQTRADAASRMIVVGVQQGISSLPPTSGQSFSYEYDAELSTFVASERLGPTSFRSPQPVGKGKWSLRLAGSYFKLEERFDPITYCITPASVSEADRTQACFVTGDTRALPQPSGFGRIGLDAEAKVGLVNLAVNYGLLDRLEFTLNLPLVIVNAGGIQFFTSNTATKGFPPNLAPFSGPQRLDQLDRALTEPQPPNNEPVLFIRDETFDDLGFDFDHDDNLGVGRISVGAKAILLAHERVQLAFAPELFFPSPNEDEFAGSESFAVLPRLVGQLNLAEHLRVHADAGYDYDFDESELRRFVWNAGASAPFDRLTVDAGVGGSLFDTPLQWTPTRVRGAAAGPFPETIGVALDNTKLGDDFIDALAGIKYRLTDTVVISGAINVPINDQGFRADAVGTGAVEVYF